MISENGFEEVQKRLQARRAGNDERGGRHSPMGVVQCDGCGLRMVVVRVASGLRYYRCKESMKGGIRKAACRTLLRVPDQPFALPPTISTMEEIMSSKQCDVASSELVPDCHTAVYARDGAVQAGQSSLEAQVKACVRQAAEDGAPPVGDAYVFRDRHSGAALDRQGLSRLRRAVQAGEIEVVYVVSLNRLSRSLRHLALLGQEFSAAGVELRFVRGAASDTGSLGRVLYGYEHRPNGSSYEDGAAGEVFNSDPNPSGRWDSLGLTRILEKWAKTGEATE